MKRLFDIIVSLSVLILLSPLVVLLIVANKVLYGSPIYFCQTRVGYRKKRFKLYKFRTMTSCQDTGDAPEELELEKLIELRKQYITTGKNDARVTKLGKLMRKFSFDELPQLWNVLKGDMSIVGPRPDVPMQRADYEPVEWDKRSEVRPGITGLAQIKGRSLLSPEDRIKWDLDYVMCNSFFLDCKILWLTAMQIIIPKQSN